jgi:hypothetical protein
MYFDTGYTLPSVWGTKFCFIIKFVINCVDPERYRPASGACVYLAYQRGGGRPVFSGWPRRAGWRGRVGVAAAGCLTQASDHLRVRTFCFPLKVLCLANQNILTFEN